MPLNRLGRSSNINCTHTRQFTLVDMVSGSLSLFTYLSRFCLHAVGLDADEFRFHGFYDTCSDRSFLPFAVSIRSMVDKVVKALEAKHAPILLQSLGIKIPSLGYVGMQFAPKNKCTTKALAYTCICMSLNTFNDFFFFGAY